METLLTDYPTNFKFSGIVQPLGVIQTQRVLGKNLLSFSGRFKITVKGVENLFPLPQYKVKVKDTTCPSKYFEHIVIFGKCVLVDFIVNKT